MLALLRLTALSAVLSVVPQTALGAPTQDEPEVVPRLSLDDFLRRAQAAQSPVIRMASAKLDGYRALFDRAYYAWTPTLKIDSLLAPLPERRMLRECVIGVHAESGLPLIQPCPGEDIVTDETISADTELGILTRSRAKVTLPIYTFGKIAAGQRAARAGLEVGRGGIDTARDRIAYEVKRAYFGVQLAASALDILADGRRRLRKAKRKIEKELDRETGHFTRNDQRKLLVREAELEAGYLETEALSHLAWEGLRIAGGFEPGQPFELESLELEPVRVEVRDVETYHELARASRPDLRMAHAAVQARQGQVDMAVADFYPDIALVGAFGFAKGTTAEDPPDPFANDSYNFLYWGVVIGAEWKIDLAKRMSELDAAEAKLAEARAGRDALLIKLRLEVTEEVGQFDRYRQALETRRLAKKAAKGWLVSNSLNFGLGLVKTEELLDSLIAFSKARLQYFRTIYEYNLAVARLSRTVGSELALPPQPARRWQPR